jgi:bisphosphoglycerate-independent phosphoglycerate mutase (AlkP superfamily)
MARPLPSLFDQLHKHDLVCASYYNWEQLRDLSSPGSLACSVMLANLHQPIGDADMELTRVALDWLTTHDFDFAFIYLGQTDEIGHHDNWMSPEYLESVTAADRCMGVVMEALPADVNYFVTADHGGHDQHHGTPMKVDMTIPILAVGPDVPAGLKMEEDATIMDIAPTITKIFDVKNPRQWTGKALF